MQFKSSSFDHKQPKSTSVGFLIVQSSFFYFCFYSYELFQILADVIFWLHDKQQNKTQQVRMRGDEEKEQNMQIMRTKWKKKKLTKDGVSSPTFTWSQKTFSGLITQQTPASSNQHARVQRKFCQLMKMETNEWVLNTSDYINRPRMWDELEFGLYSAKSGGNETSWTKLIPPVCEAQ